MKWLLVALIFSALGSAWYYQSDGYKDYKLQAAIHEVLCDKVNIKFKTLRDQQYDAYLTGRTIWGDTLGKHADYNQKVWKENCK